MTQRWTCPECKTLLGKRKGDTIEICYKTAYYKVKNPESIEAICRGCDKRVST